MDRCSDAASAATSTRRTSEGRASAAAIEATPAASAADVSRNPWSRCATVSRQPRLGARDAAPCSMAVESGPPETARTMAASSGICRRSAPTARASVIGFRAALPLMVVERRLTGPDLLPYVGDDAPVPPGVVGRLTGEVIGAVVPRTVVRALQQASIGQGSGSGGRIRTTDQGLMSPLLCH